MHEEHRSAQGYGGGEPYSGDGPGPLESPAPVGSDPQHTACKTYVLDTSVYRRSIPTTI